MLLFRDKPKTPPSFSASVQREEFKKALKFLVRDSSYLLLFFGYSLFYGIFFTLTIVISFIVKPFNIISTSEVAYLSVAPVLTGLLGNIVFVMLIKKAPTYKKLILFC